MNKLRVGLLATLVVASCGTSDGSGGGAPSSHQVEASNRRVTAGTLLAIGPFAVPAGGTVTYSITDMPTGIGLDTMDFVVAASFMVGGSSQINGYGLKQNVSSTSSSTPPLPADNYDLVVSCKNIVDDCLFQTNVTAFY